jgi:hypothetical protein
VSRFPFLNAERQLRTSDLAVRAFQGFSDVQAVTQEQTFGDFQGDPCRVAVGFL